MPDLTYNQESFNSLCSKLDDSIIKINKEYELVKECMDELNKCWDGPNYNDFMIQFNRDERQIHKIIYMLKSYKKMLVAVKQEYSKCEDNVMTIATSYHTSVSFIGGSGGGVR